MMDASFIVELQPVTDRAEQKIATNLRKASWNGHEFYVIRFGNKEADEFALDALFTFVLYGGAEDFEIAHEACPNLHVKIPASEIRSLVRQVMTPRLVGDAQFVVRIESHAALVEQDFDLDWIL